MAAGTLRKDFQNQQRAVVDGQIQMALQVALLRRAQGLVKKNLGRAQLGGQKLDFIGLATAQKQRCIGCPALAGDPRHWLQSCGLRQQAKLFKFAVEIRQPKIHPNQDGWGVQTITRISQTQDCEKRLSKLTCQACLPGQ